jgi:fatty-acyl-CoA synthase
MIMASDESPRAGASTALAAWIRALERTAPLAREPHTTFPTLIQRLAERYDGAPAVIGPEGSLSYRALAERANRYARWACAEGLMRGATVGLLLANGPDYLALWLGLTRAGLSVALLNTHLSGEALAHSIRIVSPCALVVGSGFTEALETIGALAEEIPTWIHGGDRPRGRRIDQAIESLPTDPLDPAERAPPSLQDRALYIYTSGTTGLPKAAIVSHSRIMQWTHWFCGMMNITPADRMYDCLPMYHSIGGVVAVGAPLVGGGSVVLRERFSASGFWRDVTETGCTLFQYIGELCRYLLASPEQEQDRAHTLRLACGNGLRKDVWIAFQKRFGIAQILEYYASTEGNVSLYNCEGKPGSIGRVPPVLSHRYPIAIVRSDPDTLLPVRDAAGRCLRCATNEAGEALGQILGGAEHANLAFEGYADTEATETKILRNVFAPGDAWYRTGDLMSRDEKGFFYFVDRIGDTFRWKGENVSTTEVASILMKCRGVLDAAVYGVSVPGAEGRTGMAALVVEPAFDLALFRQEIAEQLPGYARPVFLRIVPALNRTGTFKLQTRALAAEGYDPAQTADALYLDCPDVGCYANLDAARYERLRAGQEKL